MNNQSGAVRAEVTATAELALLRARLEEAEETLRAIRNGEVDALVVHGAGGDQVYALSGGDPVHRQLVEAMSQGAATVSEDGIILYGNRRLGDMLGLPLDRVIGSTLQSHFPERDHPALEALLAQSAIAATSQETQLKCAGAPLPVLVSASVLAGAGADMLYCLVITDLTEQRSHKQIAAMAEAGRRRATELAESQRIARIGSWEWTPATGAMTWSDGLNHLLGRAPDAPAPTFETLAAFYDPDGWNRLRDTMSHARDTGAAFDLEIEMRRADGTSCWTITRGEAARDADGRVAKLRGTVLDISARRLAEQTLRLQGAALDAAAAAVVITSRDGTIEWVNPAFSTLTGYSVAEAVGRNPRELVRSGVHDRAFYQAMWDTILAGDVWRGEMTNRRRDGSRYPEEQVITPVLNQHGEISHFIAMKRDLTAEKGLRAQFLQAQKMEAVGRLAGGVAHDFNNLLTVIQSYAELLLQDFRADDPRASDTGEIMAAVKRAQGLTRQLLAFSRQQVLQPVILDPNDVVTGVEKMLRRLIGEDIDLELQLATRAAAVRADPGQLEQVLLNLAVNARDAMPHGGRLGISASTITMDEETAALNELPRAGEYVIVSVTDNGTGMTPEVRARIFEPFFTTKEPGRGTGLGLATVYGIVNQSGGTVTVDSEPGKGTVFRVYLPAVAAAAAAERVVEEEPPVQGSETVLVTEDDPFLRTAAAEILTRHGYTVLTARNGEEALARARSHGHLISLLLSDVVMPGMDGGTLAARMRELHPDIRLLLTSGYTGDVMVRRGIVDSGVPFIEKPFTTRGLLRKVREVLDADAPAA